MVHRRAFPAPTGRNTPVQGNALGSRPTIHLALKGRHIVLADEQQKETNGH